jgi:hypothetical protein
MCNNILAFPKGEREEGPSRGFPCCGWRTQLTDTSQKSDPKGTRGFAATVRLYTRAPFLVIVAAKPRPDRAGCPSIPADFSANYVL